MKKNSLLFILILLIFNCSQEKSNEFNIKENKLLRIHIEDEFKINDPNLLLGYNFTSSTFVNDSLNLLIGLNNYYNKLELVNLNDKSLFNIIDLNSDKFKIPNLKIDDFYMHSPDSLFMFSPENYKVAIIDLKGEIKKIIDLTPSVSKYQSRDFLQISTVGRRNIFYSDNNNQLFFRSVPPLNWYKDQSFYSKPFISVFDISKNEFTSSFGDYPSHIKDNDKFATYDYQQAFNLDFNNSTYIVSYRTDHHLYEYELYTDKLIRKIEAKSNYLEAFDLVPRSFDMQVVTNSLIKDGNYTNLIYNSHRDEYYRIVVHNQDLVNETTGKLNHSINKRSFSIVLLDKDLNAIGEALFEKEKFNYLELTATKTGLLINYKDDENENINHFKIIGFKN